MFCLSFQVDLTTTSAAAARGAGAAAKILIYSSQNTYKRDFYCYTVIQRGKMQLWEGRWLMESRHPSPGCHHNIPPAPLCSLEVPTSYSAPIITADLPTLILFRYILSAGISKFNIIRSLVPVFSHMKEYKTPFTNFWFHCLSGSPSKTYLQHWVVFCTPEGKSCKLIHFGCCLLQI